MVQARRLVLGLACAQLLTAGVASAGTSTAIPSAADVTATATRVAPPPRTFSLVAVGDLLPESRVVEAAAVAGQGTGQRYDVGALFADIAPMVRSADLALCHVETPIGGPGVAPGVYGRSATGGYFLLGPNEIGRGFVETGFDRCSTASNHSNDFGLDGVISTLDALDAVGLSHSGTARSPEERMPTVFAVAGVRVAHLSYTRYSNTGFGFPSWMVNNGLDVATVLHDVRAVRAAGAEVVILSVHIGLELMSAPIRGDREPIEQLTASGLVDLVIEHGPHVVQPVERVNGTLVYWSVGNLVSGMGVPGRGRYSDPRILDGLLAAVRFTETSPGRFSTTTQPITICTDADTKHVAAPSLSLDDETLSTLERSRLAACLARTRSVVPDAV